MSPGLCGSRRRNLGGGLDTFGGAECGQSRELPLSQVQGQHHGLPGTGRGGGLTSAPPSPWGLSLPHICPQNRIFLARWGQLSPHGHPGSLKDSPRVRASREDGHHRERDPRRGGSLRDYRGQELETVSSRCDPLP